ncbi:MAG: hypothetical protein MUF54_20860 [Polyangiaceae bacterium]|nr:hypothetical protein [Polyangiaceae bacterium]
MTVGKRAAMVAALVGLSINGLGCGAEMVRPRASGERLEARPGRALVVGQFKLDVDGANGNAVTFTRHRVLVGDSQAFFTDEVPTDGRTFTLWVYPGVFCLGRPSLGQGSQPKLLGKGQPCVEIPAAGHAYHVGTVTWKVQPKGEDFDATLQVDDRRESVCSSPQLLGIYPETRLVSTELQPEKTAAN